MKRKAETFPKELPRKKNVENIIRNEGIIDNKQKSIAEFLNCGSKKNSWEEINMNQNGTEIVSVPGSSSATVARPCPWGQIEEEVKSSRRIKELSLINRNLANQTLIKEKYAHKKIKNHREHFGKTVYPLLIQTVLGFQGNKKVSDIKELIQANITNNTNKSINIKQQEDDYNRDNNIIDLEISDTATQDGECLNVQFQGKTLGYISKDISIPIRSILKSNLMVITVLMNIDKLELYISISFKKIKNYKDKIEYIKFKVAMNLQFDGTEEINYFFFKFKNSYLVPLDLIKGINEVSILGKCINSKFENSDCDVYHLKESMMEIVFMFYNRSKLDMEDSSSNSFQLLSQKEYPTQPGQRSPQTQGVGDIESQSEDEEEKEKMKYQEFILINIEHIISMTSNYNFLFNTNEVRIMEIFKKDLNEADKDIFAKFLTRSSKWLSKSKLQKTEKETQTPAETEIDVVLHKLTSLGLINDVRGIVPNDIQSFFKCELFTYLYYLTVDEIKTIQADLAKLTKNSTKGYAAIISNEGICEEIFINNSFFGIGDFMDHPLLKEISNEISRHITSRNFNKKLEDDRINKEKAMNSNILSGYFHKEISNSKYNQKYVTNYLNYSNFKKVKLAKVNMTQKILNILNIIKTIEQFVNDKSSNMIENFVLNFNKVKSDKREKVLALLCQFEMYSLNPTFAKAFDCATRLFFFYSDYRDINAFSKEYYGIEILEKYENYLTQKAYMNICSSIQEKENVTNGKNSGECDELKNYLKPIFTHQRDFKLFDNLYQLKTAFAINSMIMNNNDTNFFILSLFSRPLLRIANPILYEILFTGYSQMEAVSCDFNFNEPNTITQPILPSTQNDTQSSLYSLIDSQEMALHSKLIQLLLETHFHFIEDSFLSKFKSGHIASELLTYFCEACEKVRKYKISAFVYLYMLLGSHLCKKRGLWWHRLILIYSHHLKDKKITIQLLNKTVEDKFIKSGHLVKIKEYYDRFNKEKQNFLNDGNKKKSKKAESKSYLNDLAPDLFSFLNTENEQSYDENSFIHNIRSIKADSTFSKYSGRRLYSVNNTLTNVEEFAINFYKGMGFSGIHGENMIIPALYNIFFWEVIYYDKIPYVFQSPYQTFPLDFFYSDFYKNRKEIINKRINEIEHFTNEQVIETIETLFVTKKNVRSVFIDWKSWYNSKDILTKISIAISPGKLSKIFLEMAKNVKFLIKGMPDLFLWKESEILNEKGKLSHAIPESGLLVEVKSKNDKLSEHQKYWLSFLSRIRVNVEVLHIE